MTIDQYIAELARAIRSLPPDEVEQALDYYTEYLHDAQDPQAAMAQLGAPKEVAATILAGYVGKRDTKPGFKVLWAIVLGILAAPIAAPLAITAFAIILTMVIAVFAVLLSLLATGVAMCVGGIGFVFFGLAVMIESFGTAAWYAGSGLLILALGLIGTYGLVRASGAVISWLARMVVRLTGRRRQAA